MDFLVDKLQFLGLNEREIKVFTTLSTFGRMKMTKIASRSGLPRTTVDAIVRRLCEQGLVVQETVGKHFEYSVELNHVADTLDWLEKRLRSRGVESKNNDIYDEKIVNKCSEESVKQAFSARAGDRCRILLARTYEGLDDAVNRFTEYVSYAVVTNTRLELLACSQVADTIQHNGIRGVELDDPNLIRLNVVPGTYCMFQTDTIIFPDRVLMRDIHSGGVQEVVDNGVVETMKHLLDIACETGWIVNLAAWVREA